MDSIVKNCLISAHLCQNASRWVFGLQCGIEEKMFSWEAAFEVANQIRYGGRNSRIGWTRTLSCPSAGVPGILFRGPGPWSRSKSFIGQKMLMVLCYYAKLPSLFRFLGWNLWYSQYLAAYIHWSASYDSAEVHVGAFRSPSMPKTATDKEPVYPRRRRSSSMIGQRILPLLSYSPGGMTGILYLQSGQFTFPILGTRCSLTQFLQQLSLRLLLLRNPTPRLLVSLFWDDMAIVRRKFRDLGLREAPSWPPLERIRCSRVERISATTISTLRARISSRESTRIIRSIRSMHQLRITRHYCFG